MIFDKQYLVGLGPKELEEYVLSLLNLLLTWQNQVREHGRTRELQQQNVLVAAIMPAHAAVCQVFNYLTQNRPDSGLPEYGQLPLRLQVAMQDMIGEQEGVPGTVETEAVTRAYEIIRGLHLFLSVPMRDWAQIERNAEVLKQ